MILDKRTIRDFRDNLPRNISMILIIALSMALVVALCSSTDCITETIYREWKSCNVEDGSFETCIPLSKRNFKELSERDAEIEQMFYFDISANNVSTLRLFTVRNRIDLLYTESGNIPKSDGEIFLEKKYAQSHGISVGDHIEVGGKSLNVCGIGCFPDYSYVKQNSSDVAANDEFSVAAVTESDWNRLKGANKTAYNYAYKLGSGCDTRDLKDKLMHLKFNAASVKDTYLKGQIDSAEELKGGFNDASAGLKRGAAALADGIDTIGEALPGLDEEMSALKDGAQSLYTGIDEMQRAYGKYLDESTQLETVNLTSFGEKKYNIRINDAVDDSQIGKQSALVIGVFLLILLVYMLSVFAGGTIEKERVVIGTLYALGYSRHEILSHYIKIPMLVSAFGAVLGTAGGYMLTDTMAAASAGLYSFPETVHVYPVYLWAYSLGLPLIFSYVVNRWVLSKKLDAAPLKMMRSAPRGGGFKNLKLNNMSFEKKYGIRQFFRELSGNITLFFGIIVSVLLIMFSVSCYGSIKGYINGIADDVNYEYMYILRNPVTDLPKNPCLGYTRGFYGDFPMTSGEMEVSLIGIDYDNQYFGFAPYLSRDSDKIYMSDSVRIKFGYHIGDRVVLRDNAEDKLYAFEIAGKTKYGNGLCFFMNIDAMRKAFGYEYYDPEDYKNGKTRPKPEIYYYNTVFSDEQLNFKHNMMLSEVSKADMKSGASKFLTLMWDMILMMIAVSVIIFASVMYLLMKLEIDRSSFSISLLKAMGYPDKTVNSFYLGSSFYITLAAIVFGIPFCRIIVGVAYPFCVSNVNAGFEAIMSPLQYVIVILIILASYFATRSMLIGYLKKIKLTEILKNRE